MLNNRGIGCVVLVVALVDAVQARPVGLERIFVDGGVCNGICSLPPSGQPPQQLIELAGTNGIEVDGDAGFVYWAISNDLYRMPIDGSISPESIGGSAFGFITGLGLDRERGYLYWATNNQIWRANLDGTDRRVIVNDAPGVADITTDDTTGQVYWSESGAVDRIRRAQPDGSQVTVLVNLPDPLSPSGMEIDTAAQQLYFAAGGIFRVPLSGVGGVIQVYADTANEASPRDIALDIAGGSIYWVGGYGRNVQNVLGVWRIGTNGELLTLLAQQITSLTPRWIELQFAPRPLCADVSGDGQVNFVDITSVLANWGTTSPFGDANEDGAVNFADITVILANWNTTCP